ncbi:UDP-N-acetylglucosamine--peptide N-acetylglucosaminyltransferase 110 kDa subunit-like isoform X2 [Aphis craccivora]|uniref:UDP-N-acetylglucosamine--peptide N-acetylglucosaminyltransferase 110 kDa subunit-like isoform X2 n=1 Tax=Aphis craccivora TaxID=307492 RepID=A0A6G0VZ53_APHCR|nr:UDP-N-acetylglucosamine--peptide N-acetylglucosaminyltransferase 110 kDa subunit-like isoform X2 [Aphis craccivora]
MSLDNLYLNKFDIENARKAFITALYLTPENVYNHWEIGLAMHNLGQYDLSLIRYLQWCIGGYTGVYGVYPIRYLYPWRIAYYKLMIRGYTAVSTVYPMTK